MLDKTKNLQITSLNNLAEYARGAIVELPPFADGQPFVARIKRPSMMVLLKQGKIPNSLLSTAGTLFAGSGLDVKNDENVMDEFTKLIDIMAEACFVEPSYSQLAEVGLELTDDQYMFIFNYSQQGVKALDSFR